MSTWIPHCQNIPPLISVEWQIATHTSASSQLKFLCEVDRSKRFKKKSVTKIRIINPYFDISLYAVYYHKNSSPIFKLKKDVLIPLNPKIIRKFYSARQTQTKIKWQKASFPSYYPLMHTHWQSFVHNDSPWYFFSHNIAWKECLLLTSQVYMKHRLSFACFSVLTFFSVNKPIFQSVLTRHFLLSAAHFQITTTMILTL